MNNWPVLFTVLSVIAAIFSFTFYQQGAQEYQIIQSYDVLEIDGTKVKTAVYFTQDSIFVDSFGKFQIGDTIIFKW